MIQKEKPRKFPWWNLINTTISILALGLSFFTLHQQQRLNKLYIDPNLSLMIYGDDIGSSTIQIRNISIVPAVEIYVKKNIYYCSQDGKKIYSVMTESPGWYTKELLPTEIKTNSTNKVDKDNIINNSNLLANAYKTKIEPLIEFYVEFHRENDLNKYDFRQMYFLQDSSLIWSEDGKVKDNPYYSKLFSLAKKYKTPRKLPKFEEMGKYRK